MSPIVKQAPSAKNVAFLDVGSSSDIPPSPKKPGATSAPATPSDVYKNIPLYGTGSGTVAAIPRVYSQNAVQYDLSTGIRLDYTWPHAIAGFATNPLLGSGYSTLQKENVEVFTEAESTDNDFLRALGETGLLGFLAFYSIVAAVCFYALKGFTKINDIFYATIVAGLASATAGLLLNAVLIDVFEASKVAYIFWIMAAIVLATVKLAAKQTKT